MHTVMYCATMRTVLYCATMHTVLYYAARNWVSPGQKMVDFGGYNKSDYLPNPNRNPNLIFGNKKPGFGGLGQGAGLGQGGGLGQGAGLGQGGGKRRRKRLGGQGLGQPALGMKLNEAEGVGLGRGVGVGQLRAPWKEGGAGGR